MYELASSAVGAAGLAASATLASAEHILPPNHRLARAVSSLGDRRTPAALMTFFISRSISTSLLATHALEVSVGNDLVFSKLHSNRFPSEDELLSLVKQSLDSTASHT